MSIFTGGNPQISKILESEIPSEIPKKSKTPDGEIPEKLKFLMVEKIPIFFHLRWAVFNFKSLNILVYREVPSIRPPTLKKFSKHKNPSLE